MKNKFITLSIIIFSLLAAFSPNPAHADSLISGLVSKNDNFQSISIHLFNIYKNDPKAFPLTLNTLYKNNPTLASSCYMIFEQTGILIGKSMKSYNDTKITLCRSAIKMGIIEGSYKIMSKAELFNKVATLCDSDPEKNGCTDAIGKLAIFLNYTPLEASKACAYSEKLTSEKDYFFEGCMGGYGNWARFDKNFMKYKSSLQVLDSFCKGVDSKGYDSCIGYGLRSYARVGLNNNTGEKRLFEIVSTCKRFKKLHNICPRYLGFAIADIYNNLPVKGQARSPQYIASKYTLICSLSNDIQKVCLTSFVSWYMNQWSFSYSNKLQTSDAKIFCNGITKDKIICLNTISQVEARYKDRLLKAAREA